jgi:hypothetical protein
MKRRFAPRIVLIILLLIATAIWAGATAQEPAAQPPVAQQPAPPQPPAITYQPKFPGDPAHSEPEALALARSLRHLPARTGRHWFIDETHGPEHRSRRLHG